MDCDVLIVHNDAGSSRTAFGESNAGILHEVHAVADALEKLGKKYRIESIARIDQLPGILAGEGHGIVFNLVEELQEHITDACLVPAVCRVFGRACTGNDTPALLLAQNKWQTKAVLRAAGVPVPDGGIVPTGAEFDQKSLTPGRYLVKPAFSDASEGIDADSIVDVPGEAMQAAVEKIHRLFKQPAIVERFIPHRELNVSLFEQAARVLVLPIAEIDFSAFDRSMPRIMDYAAKWKAESFAYNNTPRLIPASLPAHAADTVRRLAAKAWNAAGCRDYARVDFRMDRQGRAFVIEVNPNPDISPDAGFAAALGAAGISYDTFVETSLNNSAARNPGKAALYV